MERKGREEGGGGYRKRGVWRGREERKEEVGIERGGGGERKGRGEGGGGYRKRGRWRQEGKRGRRRWV